jgi:hypothetical protein
MSGISRRFNVVENIGKRSKSNGIQISTRITVHLKKIGKKLIKHNENS